MRFPQVRLTVVDPYGERRCTFDEPAVFTVGRDKSCRLRLGVDVNSRVSRRHCQLDIDPPFISVSDLASTNGTYVNGQRIFPSAHPDDTPRDGIGSRELKDGDEIRIGEVLVRVQVVHEEGETVVDSSSGFECASAAPEPAPVLNALTA